MGWIRLPLELLHITLNKLYKQALGSKNPCLIQRENILLVLWQKNDLELHPQNYSGHHLDHVLLLMLMHYCYGTLFWQPFSRKPAMCIAILLAAKVHWTEHAFPDCLIFFHMRSFHVQNIPWCRAAVGQDLHLSLKSHSCGVWKCMSVGGRGEELGSGPGFVYRDPLFWVIQLGSILCKNMYAN